MDIKIHKMLLVLFLVMGLCVNAVENGNIEPKVQRVEFGVILDLDSSVGKMANGSISMALSDFYARNASYRTKLVPLVKDSGNDVVEAASAALELMNKEQVHAIIGPQTSTETKFVIDLGEKAQIPIISFSARSLLLSPTQNPFFIRTTQNDSSQVKALTSIVEAYGWREVVLIYEDIEYGNGLIPYLTDAFQELDIRVPYRSIISPSSSDFEILKHLNMIMARETRILLVHMSFSLGSKLFPLAKEVGMMSEGYAWIITDGLSSLFHPLGKNVFGSMHGVVGVRPYLPNSKSLQDFKTKWNKTAGDINLFGLWAYDTVWALAMAAELVGRLNPNAFRHNDIGIINSSQPFGLRVSKSGPELLQMLQNTKFEGLGGEFNLIGGQLQATDFEIFNVRRKLGERVIGNWSHFDKSLHINRKKTIIWPGHTKFPPKGWVQPVFGKRLRIGVPVTSAGFKEFLKIEWDPHTDKPSFSGFTYDVFVAALDRLPFAVPHKLIPFMNSSKQSNGTYDELLSQIKLKKFDAVVGDTTINANRSTYIDFTLPYSESGVSMVVKFKDDETKNIWIFLKPLRWDLWLTLVSAFIFTGIVVWFLEHRTNEELRSPRNRQFRTIFWFCISTIVFPDSEKLENSWSRFVLVIWVFLVLIFTQSYTASLASMLTVQKLQPAVSGIDELRRNENYFVGYQNNSYVEELLTQQLNFSKSRLRPYTSLKDYDDAMYKGSKNGGIDAIFDEFPYVKLLLAKYCSKYKVVGPTFKSAGFGFAFPIGSPLVPYFSRAILNITQDPNKMQELESKYFRDETKCEDPGSTLSSDNNPSLSVYSFGGLFIITAVASVCSCLIYLAKRHSSWFSAVNASQSESALWFRVTRMNDVPLHERGGEVSLGSINGNHLQSPPTAFTTQDAVETIAVDDKVEQFHRIDSDRYIYGCA